MSNKFKGRDFISLRDYSKDDLETILRLASDLKIKLASGEHHAFLSGKVLGMIFSYASTRTRISFETGMYQLGGIAQYYEAKQLQVGASAVETWEDTGRVLSRYLNGLVVRMLSGPQMGELKDGEGRRILDTLADNASIPVINACDDQGHPCQVMADILTIAERFGPDYRKRKVSMIWVCSKRGINPGIPHDFSIAAGTLGMRFTIACPEGYDPDPGYIYQARKLTAQSGGTIEVVHSISEAVKDASVIYAKGWKAIGKTKDEDLSMRKSLGSWRIIPDHFKTATPDAVFMNAMPISRETDASGEVVDGPWSIIYDEAENRLHVQKAIMALLMG